MNNNKGIMGVLDRLSLACLECYSEPDREYPESCTKCEQRTKAQANIMALVPDALELAKMFHLFYEKLAPLHKWKSQTPVEWDKVPIENQNLMVQTCAVIIIALKQRLEGKDGG